MDKNAKFLEKLSGGKIMVSPKTGRVGMVEQTVSGEVIFREPTSDVIPSMSKAAIEQDFLPAGVKFFSQVIWPIRFVKNGILDKFYEVSVPAAVLGDPTSNMVIEDLNKVPEIVVEETFELTKADINQYDYQINDAQLADFSTSTDRAMSVLQAQAAATARSFGKVNQQKVLTAIVQNATETIETGGLTIEEKQKRIDQTFTKYASESETLIQETINGNTYTFDTQFNQSDFVGIFNKSFSAEYKIDLFRNSFQIGNDSGVKFDLNKIVVRDFSTTYGFPQFVDTDQTMGIENVELIFVHKDAIDNLGQFEISKLLGTLKAYTKGRDYMKNNAFKVKGKPIIMFYSTPAEPAEPTATLTNITPTNPSVAAASDGSITFNATIANFTGTATATLTPTSGTTPIALSNGANAGLVFDNLPEGSYTISILDDTTEIASGQTTLTDPAA